MNRSFVRSVVVIAVVVFGSVVVDAVPVRAEGPVVWRATMSGPWELAADAAGVVVVMQQPGVRALDRHGREQWRAPVDDLLSAAPALDGGTVLVGGDAGVTALDRRDGTLRWRRPMADATYAVAVTDGVALAGDRAGALTAFDATTGDIRWSVQHPGSLWSGPRVDRASGAVVASWHETGDAAVRVLDLADGAVRWQAPTGACSAAPALHDGLVVLAVGDCHRRAWVEARDVATGAPRWRTPVTASFEEAIEPAVDARDVAVVDHFGVVTLLDRATGRLRWQHDLARAVLQTRVVLTGDRVAVAANSGEVFVLGRRDGRIASRLDADRLGGYPVALLRAPWRGPPRLLVALRATAWAVELRRLP